MRIPEWVRDLLRVGRYHREVREAQAARDDEIRRFKAEVEQSRRMETIITGLIHPPRNRRSTDAR